MPAIDPETEKKVVNLTIKSFKTKNGNPGMSEFINSVNMDLNSITLLENTDIYAGMFAQCTGLKEIHMPKFKFPSGTLTMQDMDKIPAESFAGCWSIRDVYFDNVTIDELCGDITVDTGEEVSDFNFLQLLYIPTEVVTFHCKDGDYVAHFAVET